MGKVRQVIICSTGHSGSTMLDMVIGSHPACESLGEMTLLPMEFAMNRSCTCGYEMYTCPLWSQAARRLGIDIKNNPYSLNLGYINAINGDPQITRRAYSWNVKFWSRVNYFKLRYDLPLPLALTRHFTDGIKNSMRMFELVRQLTGKDIVVDSSKQHSRAVSLYLADPEHTRLIILVRDGRGVFYSIIKRGFNRRLALNAWKRYYNNLLPLINRYVPEQHVMQIRYEDFVMHTELQCNRICEFLGIIYHPQMINFTSVVHHNVNGNDMRFRQDSKMHLDEKWKSALSIADAEYFEHHAGSMNRWFGYADL